MFGFVSALTKQPLQSNPVVYESREDATKAAEDAGFTSYVVERCRCAMGFRCNIHDNCGSSCLRGHYH